MSSEEGQKHIYAKEHQLYYYYNNFKGHIFQQRWALKMIYNLANTSAG